MKRFALVLIAADQLDGDLELLHLMSQLDGASQGVGEGLEEYRVGGFLAEKNGPSNPEKSVVDLDEIQGGCWFNLLAQLPLLFCLGTRVGKRIIKIRWSTGIIPRKV